MILISLLSIPYYSSLFFFFNDTATPEIYPLPLHDALPISGFSYTARMSKEFSAARLDVRAFAQSQGSEEHTSELQSHSDLVCRLLLEKKKKQRWTIVVELRCDVSGAAQRAR